jgi:hypothetical protein
MKGCFVKPTLCRATPMVIGLALASAMGVAQAKNLTEAAGLLETVGDPNESKFMKDLGLKVGGWINTGVTYNSRNTNGFNGPVTFGDRSDELQLNQAYLFLQRAVATEGDSFDIGGRVDFLYGSDAIFTQAYGVPAYDVNNGRALSRNHWDLNLLRTSNRFYDIALPQAYLETYIPVGNGLNIKAGHFYTPIGYEVVTSPDNFFYSKPYTFQYGEPFTHTGLLGNYTVDKNWSVLGGAVTGSATGGWDGGWDKQLGNWAGIAGVTWNTEDKATSLYISSTYGGTSEHSSQPWGLYSIVGKHNILDDLHLVIQHDHGWANKVITPGGVRDAEWYGVNSYLFYDITDTLSAGIRGEWFRDNAGFRVCSPGRVGAGVNADSQGNLVNNAASFGCTSAPASYYAATAGVTWKPLKWLNVRPNVRYDWVDGHNPDGSRYTPFGNSNKQNQFLFSTDVVILF